MKDLFENAGQLTVEQLEKLKKKIPRRGLNNFTKTPSYWKDEWGSYRLTPTLPRRMEKLLFGWPYLPPQMVAMGVVDGSHNDHAKNLLIDIFKLLENLKNNLDTVTVISREEINKYKIRIVRLKSYLRTSGKLLGLVQEAEFTLIEE